jgi:hypothetical protein
LSEKPPLNIMVYFSHISGDRYWSFERDPPPNVHINANVNLLDLEKSGSSLKVPFIFTISYFPSIAQISIKGYIEIKGDEKALSEIEREKEKEDQPPRIIFNTIASACMSEAIILSRSLGVPPPLPSFVPASIEKGKQPSAYI